MRTSADRTRPIIVAAVVAVATLVLAASPALGVVAFDEATATGHVDKADIEAAFGWREQTFQANARKLSFHLETVGSLTWDCVVGGSTVGLVADVNASRPIYAVAVAGAGRRAPVSGFDLTGFNGSSSVGASCATGSPANVVWSGTDTLFADLRSQSAAIWSH
jgi:hypothetical protein